MAQFVKFMLAGLSVFVLAGCAALAGLFSGGGGNSGTASAIGPAAGAATQSVPSILDQVEPSTRLAILSPAALLDQNASIERTVVASQCRFRSADPPFMVPNPNRSKWTFYGRVDEAKASADQPPSDAQALEYRSWFGFGTPKQQINTWPLTMVSLSQMPAQYLNDQMAMLSDHQQQIAKDDTNALAHEYIENSHRIESRVQLLVNTFDAAKCPTAD